MQDLTVATTSQFPAIAIAVVVGALAVAFAVVRRTSGGDREGGGHRFPPHRAPRPVLAVIATLVAIGTGLAIALGGPRGSSTAATAGDTLSAATDARGPGSPLVVIIAIGVIAVVTLAVTLIRMRDESR
jgi:hypothetical protein